MNDRFWKNKGERKGGRKRTLAGVRSSFLLEQIQMEGRLWQIWQEAK
jgi:hypothetical protein